MLFVLAQNSATALRYNSTMKTIICASYIQNALYHHLANGSNGVSDIRLIPLGALFPTVEEGDPNALLLKARHLLLLRQNDFPIYRAMFAYPAFIEELLTFTRSLCLYQIHPDTLSKDSASETELGQMLMLLTTLPLREKEIGKKRDSVYKQISSIPDLSIYKTFESSLFNYRLQQQLIQDGIAFQTVAQNEPGKKTLREADLPREELEAIVQDICLRNEPANIILANYDVQYPVLHQVLLRYQVPFTSIRETETTHVSRIFGALAKLALTKDLNCFLYALKSDAFPHRCPLDLQVWLKDSMSTIACPNPVVSNRFDDAAAEQFYGNRAKEYFVLIQDDLDLLLNTTSPKEALSAAYQVVSHHPVIQNAADTAAAFALVDTLREAGPMVEDDLDALFLIHAMERQGETTVHRQGEFVTVTDLSHPVDAKARTYVAGCTGSSFPGFAGMKGLFDEAYVAKVPGFPSLKERHDAYISQLDWIRHSASEELVYSWSSEDYEGREVQLAYDVETMFEKGSAAKWNVLRIAPAPEPVHTLRPDTMAGLILKGNTITGSVSSIERWFYCPYSWFLGYGIRLRQNERTALDARSIGTISHAVLEESVKAYGKQYAALGKASIHSWMAPFFDDLYAMYPQKHGMIALTMDRLQHALEQSFTFLEDYEKHTSFQPTYTERHFEEKIVEGVTLRGIFDRIDTLPQGAEGEGLVRIIDYKSSTKTLSESLMKAGLELQLPTYLVAVDDAGLGKPTATWYMSLKNASFPIPAATVSRNIYSEVIPDEEWLHKQFIKNRRLTGWNCDSDHLVEQDDDGSYIKALKKGHDYAMLRQVMQDLYTLFHDEVLAGKIALTPVAVSSTSSACTYCLFRSICRFHGAMAKPVPLVDTESDITVGKEEEL